MTDEPQALIPDSEPEKRRRPTLQQGCALSLGVLILAFGGCLAAGNMGSETLLSLSAALGLLALLVGLVLLIARIVIRTTRE